MQSKIPINRMKNMQMKVGKCSGESDQSLMNIYLGISCALLNYVLSTRFILSKPRWNARGISGYQQADR